MQKEPPVLFVMKSLYLWRVATALQLEWNRTATANTYQLMDSLNKRSSYCQKQFKAI